MMTTMRCRRATGALLLTLALGACDRGGEPPAPKAPVTIVAVDISGSAFNRSASLVPRVIDRALTGAAKTDGKVYVVAITGDTAGTRQFPISGNEGDFSVRPEWAGTDVLKERWKAQKRAAAMNLYTEWRKKAKAVKDSDYLGLLLVLDDLIAGSGGGNVQVWIVGDGFQHSKDWTLMFGTYDRADCRAKVQKLSRDGDLGQLHGAQVLFRGGGMRDWKGPASRVAILRDCWEEIIHAANGTTPSGWWDGALEG